MLFRPGQCLSVDLVGKLPTSTSGKNFIFTIIDQSSRYAETIPLKNITSAAVIKALTDYFGRFGLCKIIVSDNGTQFCSAEFADFCKNFGIQHIRTSSFKPDSNGLIERLHRSLKQSLIALSEEKKDWEKHLNHFKIYYNSTIHRATQLSPSLLFFGRNIITPLHSTFPAEKKEISPDSIESQLRCAEHAQQQARKNEAKMMEEYNSGNSKKTISLAVGDTVYLKQVPPPPKSIGEKIPWTLYMRRNF